MLLYVTKKSMPTDDPLIEYERVCSAGCYHYAHESEQYDTSSLFIVANILTCMHPNAM